MGPLVRVLLIQLQKVKVDVDLAMSGIEKLLQSQQLTFAFVGVAPSLLLLFSIFKYLHFLYARIRGSGGRRVANTNRRAVWHALRHMNELLLEDSAKLDVINGYLLIQTQILRDYTQKGGFPRDQDLKEAFLDDVRLLENSHSKRDVLARIHTSWASVLRLSEIY